MVRTSKRISYFIILSMLPLGGASCEKKMEFAVDGQISNSIIYVNRASDLPTERQFLNSKVYISIDFETYAKSKLGPIDRVAYYSIFLDNTETMLIFTDAHHYRSALPDKPYAIFTGREALELSAGKNVLVNYGSDDGYRWTSEDVRRILAR
jgi:hypothetical protein